MADPKAVPKPQVLDEKEFNKPWDREDQYEPVRKCNDPRFGDISVFKQMWNNEVVFVKEKMVSGKNEATNDIIELKKRMNLNHPHIQRLSTYSTRVQKELCSTHYFSQGIYDFPHSDMLKESVEKRKNDQQFNASELGHMAYQILPALQHLHSQNVAHGDIRPIYIGFNKATNHYHLLDRLSDASPLERLQGNLIINKKEMFVSPDLYKKLQGKDKTLKYSAQKNDLFAFGLTILTLGIGKSVQNIYLPNAEIDFKILDEYFFEFEQKFHGPNPHLVAITKWLLAIKDEERLDAGVIVAKSLDYEEYKRHEIYAFSTIKTPQVQELPGNEFQVVGGNNTYFGNVETKITYGEPIIQTYVYSTPPPNFDINKATTYVQYIPGQSINENIVRGDHIQAPIQIIPQTNVHSQINPLAQVYEPVIRRSVNREDKKEAVPENPVVVTQEPVVSSTKYTITEKGDVIQENQ
jgi:serine/threonine protein kinase